MYTIPASVPARLAAVEPHVDRRRRRPGFATVRQREATPAQRAVIGQAPAPGEGEERGKGAHAPRRPRLLHRWVGDGQG